MLMRKISAVVEGLRQKFNFAKMQKDAEKAERISANKRPPKRRRRR